MGEGVVAMILNMFDGELSRGGRGDDLFRCDQNILPGDTKHVKKILP